jgi:hypothetical protein
LLTTFTPNKYLGEVAAGASFVHPQASTTVCVGAMNKGMPIDVANVSGTTGAHKPHGHNRTTLPILIDKLAAMEFTAMHHHTRPYIGLASCGIHVLRDKPFWELPGGDPSRRRCGVFLVRRGDSQQQGRNIEQAA